MKTVYIVFEYMQWEFDYPIAVFSDKFEANKFKAFMERKQRGHNVIEYHMREFKVWNDARNGMQSELNYYGTSV